MCACMCMQGSLVNVTLKLQAYCNWLEARVVARFDAALAQVKHILQLTHPAGRPA